MYFLYVGTGSKGKGWGMGPSGFKTPTQEKVLLNLPTHHVPLSLTFGISGIGSLEVHELHRKSILPVN